MFIFFNFRVFEFKNKTPHTFNCVPLCRGLKIYLHSQGRIQDFDNSGRSRILPLVLKFIEITVFDNTMKVSTS